MGQILQDQTLWELRNDGRKEVLKLLEAGLIYPNSDSSWVIVQVVPKKGGMTVVKNDRDELIPTRTVTKWRMCIDYRKSSTKNDVRLGASPRPILKSYK